MTVRSLTAATVGPDHEVDHLFAVTCPGQGMLDAMTWIPWLDALNDGRLGPARVVSEAAKLDIAATAGSHHADLIDTRVAQPLLVVLGLLAGSFIQEHLANAVIVGHSAGDITAGALAGFLPDLSAVSIAAERAKLMAEECQASDSGMTAVIDRDQRRCQQAVFDSGSWLAVVNAPGNLVAAGDAASLQRLELAGSAATTRLPVPGAFHTPLMHPAAEQLRPSLEGAMVKRESTPRPGLLSSLDGAAVTDSWTFARRHLLQMTTTVRFDLCIEALVAMSITHVVELPPVGVLGRLLRRAAPALRIFQFRGPTDAAGLHQFIQEAR